MGEPRAITYKEVRSASEDDKGATETWRKIGEITGAGHVPLNADGNATISLTDVSDSKRERIAKMVNPVDEVVIDESKSELSKMSRAELEQEAQAVGLDGNDYTNKAELIAAINQKRGDK